MNAKRVMRIHNTSAQVSQISFGLARVQVGLRGVSLELVAMNLNGSFVKIMSG